MGSCELDRWPECELDGYDDDNVRDYRIAKVLNFTYTGFGDYAIQVANAPPYRLGGSCVVRPVGKEGFGLKVAWKNVVPILTTVVGTLLTVMAMSCSPFG